MGVTLDRKGEGGIDIKVVKLGGALDKTNTQTITVVLQAPTSPSASSDRTLGFIVDPDRFTVGLTAAPSRVAWPGVWPHVHGANGKQADTSSRRRPKEKTDPIPESSHRPESSRRSSLPAMRPDELDRRLRERLDALGRARRAELPHVLMLPDLERAERIGEFWSYPQSRTFAELLIDCEEDRTLRAVLVGMLREMERMYQRRNGLDTGCVEGPPYLGSPTGEAMKRLSPRQAEILIMRQAGLTEREIADALGLRYGTVQTYCAHLHAAGWLPGRRNVQRPRRASREGAHQQHPEWIVVASRPA